ncbi:hypothetical protein H257_15990 [Aphanomyces astaci]|uniref:Uncharacterized protein n=1 Tax=Aphanomyces astaci TaxID=112090 RepID=W4FLU2_APHAT|nr:hypothetical protein H257_15990 [Aphanomyces astaci]ETV67866.1 hypothetical protein H257_15990 [Aphanomyces astaci]|eukprot:XP_009842611.1 hypothetical protein H257_15990 [Aphanomyces astaci]
MDSYWRRRYGIWVWSPWVGRDDVRPTREQLVLSGRGEGSTWMSDPVGDVGSVVIDLELNELRISHTSYVIKLTPIDDHQKNLTTLALASPLQILPRQRRMVKSSFFTPIPRGTHVLSESLPGLQIHMARSLVIWVQVQNPSEDTIRLGCGTLVGSAVTLPHGYANAGASEFEFCWGRTDSVDTASTLKCDMPGPVKMPAPTKGLKEIPINWEGPDLSLEQREVLCKVLLCDASKAPGRTDLVNVM